MATQDNITTISYSSGEAIGQYRFVAVDATAARTAVIASAAGLSVGATLNDTRPDSGGSHVGQAIAVANGGVIKVVSEGAITSGDPVAVGAAGGAVEATTGNVAVGVAIEDGAANQIIEVHWLGPWIAA